MRLSKGASNPRCSSPSLPRVVLVGFIVSVQRAPAIEHELHVLVAGKSLPPVASSPCYPSRWTLDQVSPAKFAWLVHSVGVALASLSPISSWVGLQIGYTKAALDTLGISSTVDGFLVVLRSLPLRFFPLYYLLLLFIVLLSGRDFGSMAESEQSHARQGRRPASSTGGEDGAAGGVNVPKAGTPLRSYNALVPFATVILVTFVGVIFDGIGKIQEEGNQVTVAGLDESLGLRVEVLDARERRAEGWPRRPCGRLSPESVPVHGA